VAAVLRPISFLYKPKRIKEFVSKKKSAAAKNQNKNKGKKRKGEEGRERKN